jgi:hypothetical protein
MRSEAEGRLEPPAEAFARAWRGAPPPPRLDDFLPPPADPDRPRVLLELAALDLERRLDAGEAVRVEAYLASYPELARDRRLAARLIHREYTLRRRKETALSYADYLSRFPDHRDELRACLPTDPAPEAHPPTAAPGQTLATGDQGPPPPPGPAGPDWPAVPGYEILGKLGGGGMGVVYRARHRLLGRLAALKVLSPRLTDDARAPARFLREVEALGRLGLDHPNLVRATDAGATDDGRAFLVMELLEGQDLAALVRSAGALSVASACDCVRQAALGLQHAHEQGLVHRDVKPANLFLTAGGQVKVLDLGLARLQGGAPEGPGLTRPGELFGTCDYMAPEQWDDAAGVDGRADLYSLGCTLYFLLAGEPPFAGPAYDSLSRKWKAHAQQPPPPLASCRPDAPPGLAAILDRLLAKRPQDRFASAAELADALAPYCRDAAAGSTAAPAPPVPAAAPRRAGRRRLLTGAVLLAAAALVVGLFWLWPRPPEPTRLLSVDFTEQSRGRGGGWEPVGPLKRDARLGDVIRLEAHFSRPAYCYLIALNPDGEEVLWSPSGERMAPAARIDLHLDWELREGLGTQAFVLLATARPLPPFAEWRERHGKLPWKRLKERAGWRFDGDRLESLGPRAPIALGDVAPFERLRDHLQALPDLDVVYFVAFPVVE